MDIHITPKKAKSYMISCIKAGIVPFLQSSPGCGKSQMVQQIANQFGLKLIDHRLSTSDVCDLNGLPKFIDNKATFVPFDLFPTEDTKIPDGYNGWLLFFDEFNSASKSVQAACYKIILDKAVGQHKLHKNTAIICAGNEVTDNAIVTEMSTAMTSRLATFHMRVDSDCVGEWTKEVALPNNYDSRIPAFLATFPQYLNTFDPEKSDDSYCCPRTWEFVNKLLKVITLDSDAVCLLGAVIDIGVASAFVKFCEDAKSIPTYEDIIANPLTAIMPGKSNSLYATVMSCVYKATEPDISSLATYFSRCNDVTFNILFFRALVDKNPSFATNSIVRASLIDILE